jgi:hypothetical protein
MKRRRVSHALLRRPRRRPRRRGLGVLPGPPGAAIVPVQGNPIPAEPLYLPVPYAQQVFSLVPAAAGVVAGLLLASKFTAARATHVKASEVVTASVLSFAASFAVVFMIHSFKSYDDEEDEDAGGVDVDVDTVS